MVGGFAAPAGLDELRRLAEIAVDPGARWDAAFFLLRCAYSDQLYAAGSDPAAAARILEEGARLQDQAPDGVRRGWAALCQGWANDNLLGDRTAAPPHYELALAQARAAGDDMLVLEAQRHLGDHDHGDHAGATQRWHESTAAGARAGYVGGTLAQQLMPAVLARDAGDEAAARAMAAEVARWAGAIGLTRHVRQAEGFLAGEDPTQPPEDNQQTG